MHRERKREKRFTRTHTHTHWSLMRTQQLITRHSGPENYCELACASHSWSENIKTLINTKLAAIDNFEAGDYDSDEVLWEILERVRPSGCASVHKKLVKKNNIARLIEFARRAE